MVECQLPKLDVGGSNPLARFCSCCGVPQRRLLLSEAFRCTCEFASVSKTGSTCTTSADCKHISQKKSCNQSAG